MKQTLSELVLAYYDAERRILPWREDPTPYHVWVSEIMLQQTRVEAGVGYYERFLTRFPDVASLASADIDDVLKLWEGLGYYSRAKNLHRAAQLMMERHDGVVPNDRAELLALPGIGDYTAGAILSIAYGQRETTMDGNFYRVGSRLLAYDEPIESKAAQRHLEAFWRDALPPGRAGDFNQGVMDIGAVICLPNGAPLCERCPIFAHCAAWRQGRPDAYPVRKPKKKRPIERRVVLLERDALGRYRLRRRPAAGLLAGMWEFPMELASSPDTFSNAEAPIVHIFSHVEWHLVPLRIEAVQADVVREGTSDRWLSPEEIDGLALAAVFRKIYDRWIRG